MLGSDYHGSLVAKTKHFFLLFIASIKKAFYDFCLVQWKLSIYYVWFVPEMESKLELQNTKQMFSSGARVIKMGMLQSC